MGRCDIHICNLSLEGRDRRLLRARWLPRLAITGGEWKKIYSSIKNNKKKTSLVSEPRV